MSAEKDKQHTEHILTHDQELLLEESAGFFRGISAAARAAFPHVLKHGTAIKHGLRSGAKTLGEARPLAFASEGGVAAQSMIPRFVYLGSWGLSIAAICGDVATKVLEAPERLKRETLFYNVAFHIPASLVIPAVIIHKIVHVVEHATHPGQRLANLPPPLKKYLPVAAALLAIVPVVPTVDHLMEMIMEPTLGKYYGLTFDHGPNIETVKELNSMPQFEKNNKSKNI